MVLMLRQNLTRGGEAGAPTAGFDAPATTVAVPAAAAAVRRPRRLNFRSSGWRIKRPLASGVRDGGPARAFARLSHPTDAHGGDVDIVAERARGRNASVR